MTVLNDHEPSVSIGIDAAVVADHQDAIRGRGLREDFRVAPTLAGMAKLTERLRAHAGSLVVVEPTAGTSLPLTMAVTEAGCRIGFVQDRDSARLRQAMSGRTKTDTVDADMLARCEAVLGVADAPIPHRVRSVCGERCAAGITSPSTHTEPCADCGRWCSTQAIRLVLRRVGQYR